MCHLLALKELDLNCGGKGRGFQKFQSIIHVEKAVFVFCFQESENHLRETQPGSAGL